MKILFLGYLETSLIPFLKNEGHEVSSCETKLLPQDYFECDLLISYGYRYLIPSSVLNHLKNRAINLHISYLPWNRGADPNFWSWFENTPKGVTIHHLDAGFDTGDIIAQRKVVFDELIETLASSYLKLRETIENLFKEMWPLIKTGQAPHIPQIGDGSSHRKKDLENYRFLLKNGWDTPVSLIRQSSTEGHHATLLS